MKLAVEAPVKVCTDGLEPDVPIRSVSHLCTHPFALNGTRALLRHRERCTLTPQTAKVRHLVLFTR